MATANQKALVLEKSNADAEALLAALAPEVFFFEPDVIPSFAEALNLFMMDKVDVCFVSSKFPGTAIDAFLRDMGLVESAKECRFVLVLDSESSSEQQEKAMARGCAGAISRACTSADKVLLQSILAPAVAASSGEQYTHQQKVTDVSEAISLLIKQVDRAARNRKRGAKGRADQMIAKYLAGLTQDNKELLEQYFELFAEEAVETKPVGFEKIQIPAGLLGRDLPNLTEEGYTGASDRVWNKLAKIFGEDAKKAQPPLGALTSTSPKVETPDE